MGANRPLNSARLREVAKDVEQILGNYDRVEDEASYREFFKGIVAWRKANLDKGGYRDLMKYLVDRVQYTAKDLDRQMDAFRKKARPLFDLESYITPTVNDYDAWLRVRRRWKDLVTQALNGLPEVGAWLDKLHKDKKRDLKPTFSQASEQNLSIDGFHMILHEYDEEVPEHRAFLEMLTDALKLYQQKAKRYLPEMLRHKLPMDVMFGGNYSSGNYGDGKVTLYQKSMKDRARIVYTIAHETGHYFGLDWMSHAARAFWTAAIKQDMKPIKLSELLAMWPASAPHFLTWMRQARETDPVLAMQLDAIWTGHVKMPKGFLDADQWTREGLEDYLRSHEDVALRIMQTPITPYANENPDEAFAEASALLIAYGPQAVHPRVQEWMRVVLPGEIKLARGAEDQRVALKTLARFARGVTLDSSEIEKLRKDFLALLKNVPKVKTSEDAWTLAAACKVFRRKFNTLIFEHFLNRSLKYDDNGLSDADRSYLERKLRKSGWDLYLALDMPMYSADAFARFQEEKDKWANRAKAKARVFWKEFDEAVEYYERTTQNKGFPVKVPDEDQTVIAGFSVTMIGWGQDSTTEEDLADQFARFKEGLKIFRRRAAQTLPWMLREMLPLKVYAYLRKLDEGASYERDHIDVALNASTKNPASMAHLLAHEMGHHLYRTLLSSADKEFWETAIRGNYGPLDVEKALRLWPEGAWLFDMPQHMKDIDPTLAVQLQVISWQEGDRGPQSKEEFRAAVDSGKTFHVPNNPISGYAGKNAEEAFCEAIGFLVGYGPRTVDPLILSWLRMILPSVRTAASHYTPAENTAINLLVQSPDATVGELVKQVHEFGMDLYDEVTGQQVRPHDVVEALERFAPKPISGGETKVYHATDMASASTLLRRGLIPETKPRPRTDVFEYAPGRGLDRGLYVGVGPREVSGYGPVILEVVVPKKFLEVPTELARLGETDAMRALRNHDGAVINHRLPPEAFRILPDRRLAALKLALRVAGRYQAAQVTLSDLKNVAEEFGVGINLPGEGEAFSWDDNDSLADALLDDDTSLSPETLPTVKVAARYKEKKRVPKANGKGTTEVYVYSERQVKKRNRDKAKRLQKFSGKVEKLRAKIKSDLGAEDRKTRMTALAVALIDETHERVGNDASAKGERNDSGEPHYGVTGWKKSHVTLGSGSATIRYVGKSGVKQEKAISSPHVLKALRRAYKEADEGDKSLFSWEDGSVAASDVNAFLEPFGITAKDLRGLAANSLMQKELKKARKGQLPSDRKNREEQLKAEFKEALEAVSDELGHEASTLKSQYLAPNMEPEYLKDGTIIQKLHE